MRTVIVLPTHGDVTIELMEAINRTDFFVSIRPPGGRGSCKPYQHAHGNGRLTLRLPASEAVAALASFLAREDHP